MVPTTTRSQSHFFLSLYACAGEEQSSSSRLHRCSPLQSPARGTPQSLHTAAIVGAFRIRRLLASGFAIDACQANKVHEDLLPTFTHCWPHFCLLILLPPYLPDDAFFQIYQLCYLLSRSAGLKSTIWCCHHCLAAKLHRHFLPTSPLVWPHFFQQTDISNKIFCLGL